MSCKCLLTGLQVVSWVCLHPCLLHFDSSSWLNLHIHLKLLCSWRRSAFLPAIRASSIVAALGFAICRVVQSIVLKPRDICLSILFLLVIVHVSAMQGMLEVWLFKWDCAFQTDFVWKHLRIFLARISWSVMLWVKECRKSTVNAEAPFPSQNPLSCPKVSQSLSLSLNVSVYLCAWTCHVNDRCVCLSYI